MTTRPRHPGAKHDRVEKLRAQVEQEAGQLYYIRDGKRQPKYTPALMQEKEKETKIILVSLKIKFKIHAII